MVVEGGRDLRAAGAGQSWKEVTQAWHGGPPLPSAPLHSTTQHSSPQGPTAGLARNYGPVIAQKTVCVCVCVILVYASLGRTTGLKKKKTPKRRELLNVLFYSDL